MKLVIDIPEYLYDAIMVNRFGIFSNAPCEVIRNGTPLPKGHGRLIDADDFFEVFPELDNEPYNNFATIIEADKEAENE